MVAITMASVQYQLVAKYNYASLCLFLSTITAYHRFSSACTCVLSQKRESLNAKQIGKSQKSMPSISVDQQQSKEYIDFSPPFVESGSEDLPFQIEIGRNRANFLRRIVIRLKQPICYHHHTMNIDVYALQR